MKSKSVLILMTIVSFTFQLNAQGDLLITQKRVVFEGNKQKVGLDLVNSGKDTATYSISFLQYNMKEDGTFEKIEKPDSGQMFADPYLRIFPRKVTLAPSEPQIIMLQCRRKTDMQAGEYRSHIYFRSEDNYDPLGTKQDADSTALSVKLTPIFGISIPVIIRSGEVNVSTTLSNLKLESQQDNNKYLALTINRSGNISIYGDFVVDFIPARGKSIEIARVKGLGVYTNINKRSISIKLNPSPDTKLINGKLRVRYLSPDDAKKKEIYAVGELEI